MSNRNPKRPGRTLLILALALIAFVVYRNATADAGGSYDPAARA
jgi:hypothetical protein